jgi:hypothetical protein
MTKGPLGRIVFRRMLVGGLLMQRSSRSSLSVCWRCLWVHPAIAKSFATSSRLNWTLTASIGFEQPLARPGAVYLRLSIDRGSLRSGC